MTTSILGLLDLLWGELYLYLHSTCGIEICGVLEEQIFVRGAGQHDCVFPGERLFSVI
jgi:hypothetical protein